VFVSGLGGLKASSVGFKPQLQKAVQEAQVFVGIITPASKDREWIFYEAGAAWGRGAIYVPLLVDLAAHDLPSSIADYQVLMITGKRGNSVKFTGERHLFTGEERGGAGEVHR
jgi:hypothetical protein